MKLVCKNCQTPVPAEQVNIREGIGHCPGCNTFFRIADHLTNAPTMARIVKPEDSRIEHVTSPDAMGFRVPAPGFKKAAIGMLVFAIFWNTIAWIMFILAIRDREYFAVLFLSLFVLIGVGAAGMVLYLWKGVFSLMMDRRRLQAIWSLGRIKFRRVVECTTDTNAVETVVYT